MPYDNLSGLVKRLDINDDAIVMDSKIRDLADYFQDVFEDEQTFGEVFQHFNDLALADGNFAMNFALFFSSRILDSVFQFGSKIRAEMLNILQQNYTNAEAFKRDNPAHFYNSVTLLGEYYNRSRIAASPVKILGQSLLQLLSDQLRSEIERHAGDGRHEVDERFAKLILKQISLNGALARLSHKTEIEDLLFEVRRCLIQVHTLSPNSKALLLMTLDLYHSNFTNVGQRLETLYTTYLMDSEKDDSESGPDDDQNNGTADAAVKFNISEPLPTVSTINGLTSELEKQGGGFQRPNHIKTEFLNRPLKASDRLKYVRDQSKADFDRESSELLRQQAQFEKLVNQNAKSVPDSNDRESEDTNPDAESSTTTTTPPRNTRPLVPPVSPPQNSNWFADVEAHEQQSQPPTSSSDQNSVWIPSPDNARNHGNGSPNKYSKSVSPSPGSGNHFEDHQTDRNSQLGRSHDRNLDVDCNPLQSKFRAGRGRGRRFVEPKPVSGPMFQRRDENQEGGHREVFSIPSALKPIQSENISHRGFRARGRPSGNGPKPNTHHNAHTRSPLNSSSSGGDGPSENERSPISPKEIHHHNPEAIKYAQEFLQFLDD